MKTDHFAEFRRLCTAIRSNEGNRVTTLKSAQKKGVFLLALLFPNYASLQ
jgi:hypothetical protein